ncbi:BTAD domain-containing putative transcriptional regulator [Gordonia rubripertincta]|uniref:BTAD domain-containing putative transcriptional regulator n=1 Tax=Gordonia rubripertincta TaxID=36822 RepID=A0ABT4MY89_GORRU|nr:BTAD domain-containing putative transcriptional regulator [Gordonia rubripertincta]MCZ4551958.1 BTAD domain-containing putative transcriptional regulator [Gordonia rubripertincta]
MRYQLLGPLRVARADSAHSAGAAQEVDLGSPKQRMVLALLLIHHGTVVSTDRLTEALWGERPPPSAASSLQAYISNLRRALRSDSAGSSPIRRQTPGYVLDVPAGEVDVAEFTDAAATAHRCALAHDWQHALDAADHALSLWRGPLLSGMADEEWVRLEARGLEEIRGDCRENRITALLAVNRIADALVEVTTLREVQPFRDRSCWLHMLALYRAGRSPEALEIFTEHCDRLDAELGLEPGTELRELQSAILRHDPELAAWPRRPGWSGAAELQSPRAARPVGETAVDVTTAPRSSPIVGRAREIEQIDRLLADVAAGGTRWMILMGPPGIGKTRLAEEAAARLREVGGRDVWARSPEEGSPAWWPARQLVGALGGDPDEVLSIPTDVDPDTARFTTYERVQRLVENAAASAPLMVVIDDAQWADPMSLGALAFMATALRGHRVAVVVTIRDGEGNAALGRLSSAVARGEGNRQIVVPALGASDIEALATQVAGEAIGEREIEVLAARTAGNPLFISEYARLSSRERLGGEIPLAVRSVLGRRLAGLGVEVLTILRTAAVIGDDIDIALLSATTQLDIDELADHLDAAADDRIIVPAPGVDGYTFAHGLLREEILAGMPPLQRKRTHARVAAALESGGLGADLLSRRATHLLAALPLVDVGQAVQACRAAAEEAADRWSSETAALWWQRALDTYDSMPQQRSVDIERDDLMLSLLEALSRAGRGQTVLDTVESQLVAAMRTGRTATAGKLAGSLLRSSGGWPWLAPSEDPGPLLAVLEQLDGFVADDPVAHAQVLCALSVGHCYNPDPDVAAGYITRAMDLAAELGDRDVTAEVLMARLITYSGVATHSHQVPELIEQLFTLGHRQSRVDTVIAHSIATMATMNLGDVDAAARHLRHGIEGSEDLGLPVLRAQLRWMEAVIAFWRGDFAEARRHHEIAAHVHEQTELYVAGSGMVATMALSRDQGLVTVGPVSDEAELLQWIRGLISAGGDTGLAGVVAAGAATTTGTPVDRDLADAMVRQWLAARTAHVWTTLGHAVLLAHLVADHELVEYADAFLTELEPFADRIAIIGQVGVVGPVALALARLHACAGDLDRAHRFNDQARTLAVDTAGAPSALRCRLLDCSLQAPSDARTRELDEIARAALALGMNGLVTEVQRVTSSA